MAPEKLSEVIVARLLQEMEGYYELELYDEVVERADRLLAAGQEESRALTLKAHALQDDGRFEEAIPAWGALRRRDPANDSPYFGLGWCYKRTDRLDLAIAALETLLVRDPDNALGVYNLACYLALDGIRDRSLELLERAIELEESYREHARTETDFDALREDPGFRTLVGP
jgi:tetratricopeptide (TPR) repeat protein